MDYFLLIIVAIVVVIGILILAVISRHKTNAKIEDAAHTEKYPVPVETDLIMADDEAQESEMTIWIEQLPSTTEISEKSLFEITDRTAIARISETLPAVAQAVAQVAQDTAFKSAELYRVILPSGETLVKSKDIAGAVRGFSRGAKGIQSQANLVKVDPSKISKETLI